MLIALVVWIYLALLIAILQWPSILSMVLTFVLLGVVPVVFLAMAMTRGKQLNAIRQQQRDRRDADLAVSVQGRTSKIDNEHAGEN